MSAWKHFQISCSYAFLPYCQFFLKCIYFVSRRQDIFCVCPACHCSRGSVHEIYQKNMLPWNTTGDHLSIRQSLSGFLANRRSIARLLVCKNEITLSPCQPSNFCVLGLKGIVCFHTLTKFGKQRTFKWPHLDVINYFPHYTQCRF